jgi:NAD-dependent DNA ligase
LKQIYIDAIWDYHEKGNKTITNEQFDTLKKELTSRGSGFPSLRKDVVKFVEAYLANSRGEPILSDDEYEQLKSQVFAKGRVEEVAEFLRHVRSQDKITEAMAASTEQMKETYIDSVWQYYEKGRNPLTNEEFGKLRKGLFRRGHDMSSLHRDDIKFAAAYLAHARGEPIVSDDAYEQLKKQLKARARTRRLTTSYSIS